MVSKDIKICKICLIVSIDFCALTNFFFLLIYLFIYFKKQLKLHHTSCICQRKKKKNRQKIKKESNETEWKTIEAEDRQKLSVVGEKGKKLSFFHTCIHFLSNWLFIIPSRNSIKSPLCELNSDKQGEQYKVQKRGMGGGGGWGSDASVQAQSRDALKEWGSQALKDECVAREKMGVCARHLWQGG